MKRNLLTRFTAVLTAVLMLVPMLSFTPTADILPANVPSAATVIAWNEPAIAVNVGDVIDLSKYSVGISAGVTRAPSALTWKNGTATVKTFTPASAGVFALTASYSGGSKTVYVVAKNAADTEYVLYYNDFEGTDPLKDFTHQSSAYTSLSTVSGGKLSIDAQGKEMVRVLLPDWLGSFGNYAIEASVSNSSYRDTGRWNSIMYRVSGTAALPHPYYHMCVRKDCSVSNGVEFATRTSANVWNVITTGSYTQSQQDGVFYKYKVAIKNTAVMQSINGKDIVFYDNASSPLCGKIGLQANYSVMNVDYIKVTLQLTTPEMKVGNTLIKPSATVEGIQNAFTNVAEIKKSADTANLGNAFSAIVYTDGTSITTPEGTAFAKLSDVFTLLGSNVIPIFYCRTQTAASKAAELADTMAAVDAAVMSDDPAIVKYARTRNAMLRGIIDFRGKYSARITADDICEIREAVNANNAKTALLDSSCLTKGAVDELIELLVTVWAYSDCATASEAAEAIVFGVHGVVSPNPDNVKAAYALFESNTLTKTPLIIGHRGNPTQAPENSLSSYRIAYENGADVVETDVYLSSDGEVVIMHDSTIDRTTDGTGNIESMPLSRIKTFHLWADNSTFQTKFPDERIPTLRELFEFMKGKDLKLFIEIKTSKPAVCAKIAELAREYDISDQLCVISFSMNQCVEMMKQAPEISCGFLGNAITSTASVGLALSTLNTAMLVTVPKNTTINPSYSAINDKLCDYANHRGITIWPWTYSTGVAAAFSNAFMWGYGGLTTNDAQYTKNTVKNITASVSELIMAPGDGHTVSVSSHTYGRVSADITSAAKAKVISGSDVVKLEGTRITALKNGTAKIMISYGTKLPNNTSYTLYTEIVTVDVVSTTARNAVTVRSNDVCSINNKLVMNVPLGTTADELLTHFKNAGLRVVKGSAELLSTDLVGSGCSVELIRDSAKVDSVDVVINGDTDGNGKLSIIDCIGIRLLLLDMAEYSPACVAAASNADGNPSLSITDFISVRLHLLGLS